MQALQNINIPNETQAQRLGSVLSNLKPDITEEDRRLAIKKTGLTHATIVTYLKGKGKNNDLAAKLIEFFRNRIESREKVIA